jgi:hypothetical protein
MAEQQTPNMERRAFLRKAGVVGLAAAWATPLVQTVPMTAAYAHGEATPRQRSTTRTTTTQSDQGTGDHESD